MVIIETCEVFFMVNIRFKRRFNVISLILVLTFLLLSYRLFYICYYKKVGGNTLDVIADSQYCYTERTNSLNYRVLDKSGTDLLAYNKKYRAVLDPIFFSKNDFLKYKEEYDTLYYILKNYDSSYDVYNYTSDGSYKKLIYNVDAETYDKLKSIKNLKGFYIYEYLDVDKSDGNSIENIITANNSNSSKRGKGTASLNKEIYDNIKNNKYPTINYFRDVNGNIINSKQITPEENLNIKLTIDSKIEKKVHDILNDSKYNSLKDVGVVLMESNTGNILTLTQKNNKRANVLLGLGTENGSCPGSIFKVIVEETALQNGSLNLNQRFHCQSGKNSLCKEEHGYLNVDEAFTVSCNNTFKQICDNVDYKDLLKNAKSQGLFNKVFDIEGEKMGDIVTPKADEGGNRLISIGQNMRITPVQAVSIVNTVVTGGQYVKPRLIDSYINNKNKVVEKEKIYTSNVVDKTITDIIKNQMKDVVTKGTGVKAYVKGIENGGKTGTSTWVDEKSNLHSDGWFIGYFNISGKYYSMVVFVKDIDMQKESGGNTAAPIFKDIVEGIKNTF